MKTFTTLIFCLLSLAQFPASAGTLACSHPELCKLAAVIADENHLRDLETKSLIHMTGDPHEYEPSTAEIKALMSAPVLIIGPSELNPWIKKIHFQRSKNPALKTISLPFEKKMLESYPLAQAETLSHFWLYPKIYCAFKKQLTAELKKNGENVTEKNCDSEKVEKELRTVLLKIKKPLILTHDALLPLLASLAPGELIVAIKGSGHHQEAGIGAIKKMYQALEAPSVIWIVENEINIPQNILNKIRPTDSLIKLDTANSSQTKTFSILTELAQKLSLAGGKK